MSKTVLDRTYPINTHKKQQYLFLLVLALWVFLFLFFAEPFKIHKFSLTKKLWALPIYGIIQSFCVYLALGYQNKVLRKGSLWTLKNELLFILLAIGISWIINFSFYRLFVTSGENTYSFLAHARFHFLPGLFIVLPVIIIGRYFLGTYFLSKTSDQQLTIRGNGVHELLSISFKDLYYLKSENNYVNIFYALNDSTAHQLIRTKLSTVQEACPSLLKVHRSYLINPKQFKSFKHQPRKLFIVLQDNSEIPVSKNYKDAVLATFSTL